MLLLCLSGSACPGTGAFRTPQLLRSARPAGGHSGGEPGSGALRHSGSGPQSKSRAGLAHRVTFQQAGDQPPAQDTMPYWRVSPAPAWSPSHPMPTWFPGSTCLRGCTDLSAQRAGEATSLRTGWDCSGATRAVVRGRTAWPRPTSKEIVRQSSLSPRHVRWRVSPSPSLVWGSYRIISEHRQTEALSCVPTALGRKGPEQPRPGGPA